MHSRRQIRISAGESKHLVSLTLWWAVPFQTLSPWGRSSMTTDWQVTLFHVSCMNTQHAFIHVLKHTQACGSPHENTHTWVTLVASSPSIAHSTVKARSLHWHTISDTWPQSHIWLASQWNNDQPAYVSQWHISGHLPDIDARNVRISHDAQLPRKKMGKKNEYYWIFGVYAASCLQTF